MAQCVGQNQRTGERCKRSAAAGAETCYYHGPAAKQLKQTKPRRRAGDPSARPAFTTEVLSPKTFADFEALFAPGTGWGRCACLFALDARRATNGGTWAHQREVNLATMRGLVQDGRSQGVLVYDGPTPVGWCQFVSKDHLRFDDMAASGADWFITCFVVEPAYRGLGVTEVALRAALDAIGACGGGVVEARATAIAADPPPKSDRKDAYVEDDVLFLGGSARVRYNVAVEGAGAVAALYPNRRSMHSAPLGGTVEVYRRAGFDAVAVAPRQKSALADRVVMRRVQPSSRRG